MISDLYLHQLVIRNKYVIKEKTAMQAWKIMARNIKSKQRVQQQFLDGTVITDWESAMQTAQALAQQYSQRTRETWVAEVTRYTVGHKPGS